MLSHALLDLLFLAAAFIVIFRLQAIDSIPLTAGQNLQRSLGFYVDRTREHPFFWIAPRC
jgi:hypothetical protein